MPKSDIYEQHKAAFAQVSAYVITLKGERVATIAFKYPRDGASNLYAYVHWLGIPMVRGWAGGCGYDKHSAACQHAMKGLRRDDVILPKESWSFTSALANDGGSAWYMRLRHAGFDVLQAV